MAPAGRRRLAYAFGIAAVLLLVWACLLALSGGFDSTVLGLTIRSHNFWKPAQWGLLAFALYAAVRGFGRPRALIDDARALDGWLAHVALPYPWLAAGLAVAIFVLVWQVGIWVAGGSDSYGYLSQAQFWLHGAPIVPQPLAAVAPWPDAISTMTPLGYRPVTGTSTIVPTYAVGLPLFLAGVQWLAGYVAIFWTWPVAAALMVLAAHWLGRELGSPATGLIAAWLMATDTTLIVEAASPASDVPVSAALAICCCFLFRRRGPAPIRAGAAASVAVLIRPNMAGTVALLALWLALQPALGSRTSWRAALQRAVLFGAAAAPGFLVIALANRALFGSAFVSGYGALSQIYMPANVLINLRNYAALIVEQRTELLFVGLIAVCLTWRRLWPDVEDRSVFVGVMLFVGSIIVQFLLFQVAVDTGFLRYVLACWPLLLVGVAVLARLIAKPGWRAAAVAFVLLLIGARNLAHLPDHYLFGPSSERKYPQAAAIVRERAEPNSVVFAMQHSGSVRFYSGLLTIRYDVLQPDWLDRAVAWLHDRGIHSYAVLDDWEVPSFREHFPGQERLAALDRPAFTYQGAVATHIFDLSAPPVGRAPTAVVQDDFGGPRIVRPAPTQVLRIER